jgi:demethylmenaquinone methyltransferase/2-methoxy-6-polyprenyl-1,4-benzoquinol methylase
MGVLEDKSRARLFYRYLSKVYDRVNPFVWTEAMRTEALDMLEFAPDDRVLDVGCGTGFATAGLLERVETVHGIDQSVHQLDRAWDKFGKRGPVRFYMGDAERLPFEDDSFDVVWSSGSIEYWPDPVATLREFRRVLRPGGQVLVVGPTEPSEPVRRRLANAMMLFYDEEEAQTMFEEAGFTDVHHRLMGPDYEPTVAITTVARAPDGETGAESATGDPVDVPSGSP